MRRAVSAMHRDGQRGQERGWPEQDVGVEHPLADMETPERDHVFEAVAKPPIKSCGIMGTRGGKHQFFKSA